MGIKKDLKARGLFINKRKRAEMYTAALALAVFVGTITIMLVLLSSIATI
jgi:hypothetical protein